MGCYSEINDMGLEYTFRNHNKYNMHKILPTFLTLISISALAQQKPQYTQYVLNQYIINPALSGIENYTDVKLSYRHQWTGINRSPATTYFTIHMPIGKKDYRTSATSYPLNDGKNHSKNYWGNYYYAAKPHHGIGLQVVNDASGPLGNISAYATYAYHLGLSAKTSLAAGFGAGFSRYSLNASLLDFNNITVDPVVYSSGYLNSIKFDMNAGLYLYSGSYFVGLSAQQIVPSNLDFSNNTITTPSTGKTVPHIFATAGFRYFFSENVSVIPSLMLKYISPLPVLPEVNCKVQFRDLFWLGGSYRYNDSWAGMIGFNVNNKFNIGYAFDHTISALNTLTKTTQEFMIGIIIGNNYNTGCPARLW
jgi:type IX secretion system PorP/SprF family membrane protein